MAIQTKPNFFIASIIALLSVAILVYFNYLRSQSDINATRPAPLSIQLTSYPESLNASSSGSFFWTIDSSPDLSTTFTTIYWGYESSPSALTTSDSPDAVRYPYSQADYAEGIFRLPNSFDVNVVFDKPGVVWFRAYAKVQDSHLWTEERFIEVK